MKFREIDDQIAALLTEDGEILDVEAFDRLQLERGRKIEGLGNFVLNLRDDLDALKRERERITTLIRQTENRIESIRNFLAVVCGEQPYNGQTIKIGFRHTRGVEVQDQTAVMKWALDGHEDALKYDDPTILKSVLKAYMEMGIEVPGAVQVDNVSTVIR